MTTHFQNRCTRCGISYIYQGSGPGIPEYNDGQYCPDCAKAIQDALAKVPRLFEKRQRLISEVPRFAGVTLAQLQEWERQTLESQLLKIRQVGVGLYNPDTGDTQSVRAIIGRNEYSGIKFWVAFWRLSGLYEVTVDIAYNLTKQEFTDDTW